MAVFLIVEEYFTLFQMKKCVELHLFKGKSEFKEFEINFNKLNIKELDGKIMKY